MLNLLLMWVATTIVTAHIGIAYGLLLRPGNLLDRLAPRIEKIKWTVLRDLLSCVKCVSGQAALWLYVWYCLRFHVKQEADILIIVGILWISSVIVVTDQLNRRYGYS